MLKTQTRKRRPNSKVGVLTFTQQMREIDMFFLGKDKVHQTMHRTAKRLEKARIPHALVGGMALGAHHYRRATMDAGFLISADGFEEFRKRFVGKYFDPVPGRPRRFTDRRNGVGVDFLVTGRFPGTGKPGPVAYPDPNEVAQVIDTIRVVDLVTLVQLKLAAQRYRDFGDVAELIRFNNLDESFADRLHPSVRRDYIECLEEKRREDEYISRED